MLAGRAVTALTGQSCMMPIAFIFQNVFMAPGATGCTTVMNRFIGIFCQCQAPVMSIFSEGPWNKQIPDSKKQGDDHNECHDQAFDMLRHKIKINIST